MLKNVGFLQYIKKDWLDATVAFYKNSKDLDKIKANLDKLIQPEVPKSEERRKTIDVLTRSWIRIPSELVSLREKALKFYDEIEPDERIVLHWGMLLMAYPFFHDISNIMGSLLKVQDTFTSTQLKNRLVSKWGHRTTIIRAIDRVLQSLKDWNIVYSDEKSLQPCSKLKIKNESLCLWFLETVFRSDKTNSILFAKLITMPVMFPFQLDIQLYKIKQAPNFEHSVYGMNMEMMSLRQID